MDATRDHLLGRILLERRVIAEEELRRLVGERDETLRRGGRVSLGQLLVRERRIDAVQFAALQGEIELRGRACYTCRRAYLVAPGGPVACPVCGGPALLPATPTAAAAVQPPSGVPFPSAVQAPSAAQAPSAVEDYSPSGRFPANAFQPPSGRFPPTPGAQAAATGGSVRMPAPSSGRFTKQAIPVPMASGFGPPGSSAPGLQNSVAASQRVSGLAPSYGATPPGSKPASTDPGSGNGAQLRQGADLGKTLGPYDLLQELGRGGMGVVYKARRRDTNQIVALKVLLSGEFASPKMLARFKEEASTVQKLEHENVVPIFDVGMIDGTNYFTMKFVEGELLQDLIRNKGLSARRGAEILRDVARGAHHAHENGVIHRDLKPANVIVETESGTPFIMDFGLAKNLDDDKHLTKTGVAIGTPYYMSPEQAQGKHREIDARSDVYALGAMLYEVLARRTPFNADSQTLLLRKIVEDEPIPPSQIRQGVPPDLETIALKALRKKKEERYSSAEEMAQDLERAIAGRRIVAKREAPWAPLVRKLEKNPRAVAGIAVSLVLCAAGVSYGVYAYKKAQEAAAAQAIQAALDKRKGEVEKLSAAARGKRLAARGAVSAGAARNACEDAILGFTNALDQADEGWESQAAARYERGLARRDVGTKASLAAALEDWKLAAACKGFAARAHLAAGVYLLRRERNAERARVELEAGREPGQPSERQNEEEAAALLAQGYVALVNGDPSGANRLFGDAERKAGSSDAVADVYDAQAWVTLSQALVGPASQAAPLAAQALRFADRSVAQERWRYDFLCTRALAGAMAGDRRAQEDVKAAKDAAPDLRDVRLAEAWLAAKAGRVDDVKPALAELRREIPAGRSLWDQLEPKLVALAQANKPAPPPPPDQRREQKKSDAFPGAIELWEDCQASVSPKGQARATEFREAMGRRDFEAALVVLAKLAEEDTENTVSLTCFRGRMLADLRRFAEARRVVEGVLQQVPDEPVGNTVMGIVVAATEGLEAGKPYFRRAIEKFPRLRTPRYVYCGLLRQAKSFDEAAQVIAPYVQANEGDSEMGFHLANTLCEARRFDDALEVTRKLVARWPRLGAVRIAHATALRASGKLEECLRFNEESDGLFPGNWLFLSERAETLWLMKEHDKAEELWRQSEAAATSDEERRQLAKIQSDLKTGRPR